VRKDFDSPPVVDFPDALQKSLAVLLVNEDLLPRAATVHDMINGGGVLNTKRASHIFLDVDEAALEMIVLIQSGD
jgi:hypothetical protein